MMDNKLVQRFYHQVNEIFSAQRDKDAMFEALKRYQSSSDIKKLVQELKRVVNEPQKLEIYDYIRPLIRPQHQQGYDKMAPQSPRQRLKVIRLRHRGNESFGFAVRGGYEHGIGVFVSHVEPGSQAAQKGLKMGDEIVRVNGFTIAQAIHEEVLNLIKGRNEIELKVTSIGMVPIKQKPTDPVTWQYVDKPGLGRQQSTNVEAAATDDAEICKIFINLHGATSLGCSIISGPKQFPGIFVETVRAGGLGEVYGLEVGDQIMEVNGKSFLNIKHKEAIVELKGSKELNMIIKKGVGLSLLNMKYKAPKDSPEAARKDSTNQNPAPDRNSEEIICEILDNNLVDRQRKTSYENRQRKPSHEEKWDRQRELERQMEEDRKKLEREHEDLRRKQEQDVRQEEQARLALERQMELERQEKEAERHRQLEEEKRRQDEERRNDLRRKLEQQRQAENERKKFERDEERRKQEALAQKQQSAVLAGRLAPRVAMKPTLLGAAPGSEVSTLGSGDKVIKEVSIRKDENMPLDITIEGGIGSPLGDKILVANVYPGGAIEQNGEIQKGDQILEINGGSLREMSSTEVDELLWETEQQTPTGGIIRFLVSESEVRASQDEVSSEAPTSDLDYLDYMRRHNQLNWDSDDSPVTYIY